jgi:hypothetical protein
MRSRWLLLFCVLVIPACDERKTEPAAGTPPPGPTVTKGPSPEGNGPTAADTPYVRGSVLFVGPWNEERLAAGFAGQGADGKPHSNMAGTTFSSKGGTWVESLTFKPQITGLDSRDRATPEYRHTHMLPGEYVVYVLRGGVPAAWKKVSVKDGDQQTVDLTIDPAKTGGLKVTLPDAEANEGARWPLQLIPVDIDLPGTAWHQAFQAAEVKPGEKVVSVNGVPAGKYHVARGKSKGEVEVTAGKTAEVTLVRDEPKKK